MSGHRIPSAQPHLMAFNDCHITRKGVQLGGVDLPGVIAKGGVVVKRGNPEEVNTVTVTFFVSDVVIDDDAVGEIRVES